MEKWKNIELVIFNSSTCILWDMKAIFQMLQTKSTISFSKWSCFQLINTAFIFHSYSNEIVITSRDHKFYDQ